MGCVYRYRMHVSHVTCMLFHSQQENVEILFKTPVYGSFLRLLFTTLVFDLMFVVEDTECGLKVTTMV